MRYIDEDGKPLKFCLCGADLQAEQIGVIVSVSDGLYVWEFNTILSNGLLVDVKSFVETYKTVSTRCRACETLLDDLADVV